VSRFGLAATPLAGVMLVRSEAAADARGTFVRLYCRAELAAAGIDFVPVQISASHNPLAGTLRGLHWQAPPHAETKLVRVTRGRSFHVAADLRAASGTLFAWHGVVLAAGDPTSLLVPPGVAHGFVTLADDTEVTYAIDIPYRPDAARGARFDDPVLAIAWPRAPAIISERDRAWPDLAGHAAVAAAAAR
jgi:dTDP-4-dehydrorhamnose 3,5-epimerase